MNEFLQEHDHCYLWRAPRHLRTVNTRYPSVRRSTAPEYWIDNRCFDGQQSAQQSCSEILQILRTRSPQRRNNRLELFAKLLRRTPRESAPKRWKRVRIISYQKLWSDIWFPWLPLYNKNRSQAFAKLLTNYHWSESILDSPESGFQKHIFYKKSSKYISFDGLVCSIVVSSCCILASP